MIYSVLAVFIVHLFENWFENVSKRLRKTVSLMQFYWVLNKFFPNLRVLELKHISKHNQWTFYSWQTDIHSVTVFQESYRGFLVRSSIDQRGSDRRKDDYFFFSTLKSIHSLYFDVTQLFVVFKGSSNFRNLLSIRCNDSKIGEIKRRLGFMYQ